MSRPDEPQDDRTRREELAALDALERRALDVSDLSQVDPEYLAARASFEAVAEELASAIPPKAPPASLKEKLLARIRTEDAAEFDLRPGVHVVRSSKVPWSDSPLPGLVVKLLHHDPERRVGVRLLRIEPGASYPKHRHGGAEEIFVIEGSVFVAGTRLVAGDYCRSEPGTEEQGTFSDEGGTAIVVSSDLDEIGV